ncbi:MAG: hypothetical protein KGL53_12180, partial [Elusimicrobia bacterium]|nr:hypothetical protein [Elusimicrobiota bacterium]
MTRNLRSLLALTVAAALVGVSPGSAAWAQFVRVTVPEAPVGAGLGQAGAALASPVGAQASLSLTAPSAPGFTLPIPALALPAASGRAS